MTLIVESVDTKTKTMTLRAATPEEARKIVPGLIFAVQCNSGQLQTGDCWTSDDGINWVKK